MKINCNVRPQIIPPDTGSKPKENAGNNSNTGYFTSIIRGANSVYQQVFDVSTHLVNSTFFRMPPPSMVDDKSKLKSTLPRTKSTRLNLDLAAVDVLVRENFDAFNESAVLNTLRKINDKFDTGYTDGLNENDLEMIAKKLIDLQNENQLAYRALMQGYSNSEFLATFIDNIHSIEPENQNDIEFICRLISTAKSLRCGNEFPYNDTKTLLIHADNFVLALKDLTRSK